VIQGVLFTETGTEGAAVLSDDLAYRYMLRRTWCPHGPHVNFVMLNPSTADASEDDNTIKRCMRFARDWGYGGIVVTNLFALRSTDPSALKTHPAPIGPENDAYLRSWARSCGLIVCAWGNDGAIMGRAVKVLDIFRREMIEVTALKVTQEGHPCHPLRLPASLTPKPYLPRPMP
jgi:hypothetical protein